MNISSSPCQSLETGKGHSDENKDITLKYNNVMEVTVGREQHSRRLSVIRDGKTQLAGNPGSVPMDVSRQHVSLCSKEKNKWEIKNLNDKKQK